MDIALIAVWTGSIIAAMVVGNNRNAAVEGFLLGLFLRPSWSNRRIRDGQGDFVARIGQVGSTGPARSVSIAA